MSTTTIRLTADLKERIARAAKRAGITAHSFILEAIAEKAEEEERRAEFHESAEQRYAEIVTSGKTVPWTEVRHYLERRLTGKSRSTEAPNAYALVMPRVELAPEVSDDFERIVDHLLEHDAAHARSRIEGIIAAIDVLERNPLIGRPVGAEVRELVIGRRERGYLALYRYIPELDIVFVLAVLSQKEAGYSRM